VYNPAIDDSVEEDRESWNGASITVTTRAPSDSIGAMRVIVFGAAGRTGGHLVDRALARGHEVTPFVRRSARRGVPEVIGDVRDPRAVEDAVRGHDAILSALGHASARDLDALYSTAARNFVAAMEHTGVERVICVSGWIEDSLPKSGVVFRRIVVPLMLRRVWDDLAVAERIYRSSSVKWTCVRASRLTDGPERGRYRSGHDVTGNLFSSISRADVASFMLEILEEGAFVRESPMIVD
jgi:putative NADH-flavin reductase